MTQQSATVATNQGKGKPFWLSKTFWVNILAIIAMVIQYFTGWVFPPIVQATALSVINLILRAITKHPIQWRSGGSSGNGKQILLIFLVPFLLGVSTMSTGCTSLHDVALRKPVRLITCEYEQYVKKDKALDAQDKRIRCNTAKLLREQVKAKPCPEGPKDGGQ